MADIDLSQEAGVGTDSEALLGAIFEPTKEKKVTTQVPQLDAKAVEEPKESVKEEEKPDDEDTALAKLIGTEEDTEGEEEGKTPAQLDDSLELEVKVNEEVRKVTLKELKENFSGEGAISARIEKAARAQQAAEQQANTLYSANQRAIEKLQQIDEALKTVSQQNIDWDQLRATDPLQYALKRDEIRSIQEKQQVVRQEAARVAQEQQLLQSQAQERYLTSQAEALQSKMPELRDHDKAQALMSKLTDTAMTYGYTREEVGGVMDHRALLVLRDAAKYRDLVAKKASLAQNQTPAVATKVLRTVATQPASVSSQRKEQAILKQARTTGKPDDVAMTLLIPQRKKG